MTNILLLGRYRYITFQSSLQTCAWRCGEERRGWKQLLSCKARAAGKGQGFALQPFPAHQGPLGVAWRGRCTLSRAEPTRWALRRTFLLRGPRRPVPVPVEGEPDVATFLSPRAWATTWNQMNGPALQGGGERGPQGGGSLWPPGKGLGKGDFSLELTDVLVPSGNGLEPPPVAGAPVARDKLDIGLAASSASP